ncbi:MAG: hypothetical protein ACOX8R_02645 [Bacillota bacterium]|jgi:hypothetical protein
MNNNAFDQLVDLLAPKTEHRQRFVIGTVSADGQNVTIGELTLSLRNFTLTDHIYKAEPGARLILLDYDGQHYIVMGELRDDY